MNPFQRLKNPSFDTVFTRTSTTPIVREGERGGGRCHLLEVKSEGVEGCKLAFIFRYAIDDLHGLYSGLGDIDGHRHDCR